MRAVHRLALMLVPADPETGIERVEALADALVASGMLVAAGDAWEPGAVPLVAEGFRRARIERFPRVRFVSSGMGGFSVRCPDTGDNAVGPFIHAFTAWTAGGDRALVCGCGARHDLAVMSFAPEAAFGRAWIELQEVEDAALTPAGLALAESVLGGVRVIPRRG